MLYYALRALATAVLAAPIAFLTTVVGIGLMVEAGIVSGYRGEQAAIATLLALFVVVLPQCWRWAAR